MHYFLRQVLSPDCDLEPPIEIHLYADSVDVGRRQLKSLTRFPQISRNHAAFYKSDDGNVFVKDLDSLNGVYVNDTRIGSSLKRLNSGDVIGFGVASSGAAEGFVCVLCTADIDIEELEITDDEQVEITDDDKSSKKSNFKTSVQRESGLNTPQVASHNNNNNAYLPDIYELSNVSKHQNSTKNTQRKVERGESSSHARDGVTCYDNSNSNPSESPGIISVSRPQNDVQGEPICKGEAKCHEHILLRDYFIPLVRCDDSSFQFPPDVKNPFKTGQRKRKRTRILNTDSSDDSDEGIPESTTTDSSEDSDENVRVSAQSKAQRTRYSANNKHQRKQSRKLSTDSSDSNKHERKRPRNPSSVCSDDSGKILYARTSSETRLNADALTRDKNGHDCRTNSDNQVSGRKGTLPRSPDLEELNYKRSSSKTEDNLKAEAKISFGNQDDGAGLRYSQADTFYTSDDEIYLDMKSSQDCALMKLKTKDTGDSNSESDTCEEIFGRENSYSPTPNTAIREGHSDDRTESIEAILAFIQGTKNSKPDSCPPPRDSVIEINRSIFPLPSRDADGEQSPEYHSDASNDKTHGDSSGEVRNSAGGERISLLTKHKGIRQSARRTLFTEPKPLTYRARRFRGRDENFVERKKPQTVPPRAEKTSSDRQPLTDTKNSNFDDYTPPPPAKKRISHFASKVSTSNSSGPNLAPNDSSPPSQPSSLVDVVEKNTVGIETTKYSRGNAATRLPPVKNDATRLTPVKNDAIRLTPAKNTATRLTPVKNDATRLTPAKNDATRLTPAKNAATRLTPVKNDAIRLTPAKNTATRLTPVKNDATRLTPAKNDATRLTPAKNAATRLTPVKNDATRLTPAKNDATRLTPVKNDDTRLTPAKNAVTNHQSPTVAATVGDHPRLAPAKNAATNHQSRTVAATVGDHQRLPARLEGSNGVLRQLLQMNTRWLQEQAVNSKPPPDVSRGATGLPASFDSHESYVAMFRPLIILEIWERLYARWREVQTDGGQNCKFHFEVLRHTERGGCVELECESVSADGRPGPHRGDVTLLELKEGPAHNQCKPLFGYILGHTLELLEPDCVLGDTSWKQLTENWRSGGDVPKRWKFRACVKRKRETPSFDQNSLMRGYNLGCVRNLLCWADAFSLIRDSPLLDTLLRPATYALPTSQSQSPFDKENLLYTCEQEAFIRTVCDTVVRRSKDPEVFLLRGDPGTGKTHVIVGLIERLFYHQGADDIRVVVAAPSDSALDEIGCRLARRFEGTAVRLVRLGHERQVDSQMVLRRSHVVLSTLSYLSAAHQLRPSICIVDDASKCTEPESLQAVATGAAMLVLAGDTYQEDHASCRVNASCLPRVLSRVACHYRLDRSLFERVMLSRQAQVLTEQFRMHPDIARFPCPSSFPSPLRPVDISHLRPYLVLDLPDDEDPLPVAVVCEFVCSVDSRASVAALVEPSSRRTRFSADASEILSRHAGRVEVCSPGDFLGREKDVVVLWAALTCCSKCLLAALTRARKGLIVCVTGQKVVHANPLWAKLLTDAEERGVLYSAPPTPDHLKRMLRRLLLV